MILTNNISPKPHFEQMTNKQEFDQKHISFIAI